MLEGLWTTILMWEIPLRQAILSIPFVTIRLIVLLSLNVLTWHQPHMQRSLCCGDIANLKTEIAVEWILPYGCFLHTVESGCLIQAIKERKVRTKEFLQCFRQNSWQAYTLAVTFDS